MLYPNNRHLSPTVRAFVDWVSELVSQEQLGWPRSKRAAEAR